MTTRTRSPRRRASILLAGAVALSTAGCSLLEGGDEPTTTSSSSAPLTTTSTSEPPTSTSSTTTDGSKNPPNGNTVLNASRSYMKATNNVTIAGTLYNEDLDLHITIRAEGSTGGLLSTSRSAGAAATNLSVPGGGRMEALMIGFDHYVRVNKAWLEATEAPRDSPMRKHVGTWVRVPFDHSPLDGFRPQMLLKGTFFGDSLTPFDAKRSPASFEELGGKETYRVAIRRAGKEGGPERIVWISTDTAKPVPIKLTYGQDDERTTLNFSGWNSSREDFSKPAKAKTVEDLSAEDLGTKVS